MLLQMSAESWLYFWSSSRVIKGGRIGT